MALAPFTNRCLQRADGSEGPVGSCMLVCISADWRSGHTLKTCSWYIPSALNTCTGTFLALFCSRNHRLWRNWWFCCFCHDPLSSLLQLRVIHCEFVSGWRLLSSTCTRSRLLHSVQQKLLVVLRETKAVSLLIVPEFIYWRGEEDFNNLILTKVI